MKERINNMLDKYDEIFEKAMIEKGLEWYELFDGKDFEEVEKACRKLEDFDEEAFDEWVYIMSQEL